MDLMQPITEESLRAHFGYLFTDYGFSIKDNVYDEGNFGNAVVVLVSRDLHLRIIRDRGQIFLDIGSPMDQGVWFDLNDVLAVINRGSGEVLGEGVIPYRAGKVDEQIQEISGLLRRSLPDIINLTEMAQRSPAS